MKVREPRNYFDVREASYGVAELRTASKPSKLESESRQSGQKGMLFAGRRHYPVRLARFARSVGFNDCCAHGVCN